MTATERAVLSLNVPASWCCPLLPPPVPFPADAVVTLLPGGGFHVLRDGLCSTLDHTGQGPKHGPCCRPSLHPALRCRCR